jgi:hypothetical protein
MCRPCYSLQSTSRHASTIVVVYNDASRLLKVPPKFAKALVIFNIMSEPTQSAIIWPHKFLPGLTDNFVSNEVIVKDIKAAQIWDRLNDIAKWETYYKNCEQITPPASGTRLQKGNEFKFSTFGFPVLSCRVEESVAPRPGVAGRLAWVASLDGNADEAVEVYHAWLVEDLAEGRARILTQESQIGKPVAQLAQVKPNRMLLGHQDWLDGLVRAVRGEEMGQTNLGSIQL